MGVRELSRQASNLPAYSPYQESSSPYIFQGFTTTLREKRVPYSMTGFGAGEGPAGGGRLRMEIRTVNHRYFNLALKLPGELAPLEGEAREALRKEFDRGHIAVQARWVSAPTREARVALNLDRAREVLARMKELQAALGLPGEVSLELVARQPEVLSAAAAEETEVTWGELEPIVRQAAAECRAMRRREGDALGSELLHRLGLMDAASKLIAARAPERLVRERDRMRSSVRQLLDGNPADETRLAQEIAFLADRLDITEELVRFAAHVAACRKALSANEPAGKQLGFLAQELGREINTMGSKANDAEILQQVIAMKGELEKFREQLENIE